MKLETLFLSLIVIAITAYYFAMRRAVDSVNSQKSISKVHSMPSYHGYYAAICSLVHHQ